MKKLLLLTLCLVLLVAVVASCNSSKSQNNASTEPIPNADPKKAAAALEAAGYEVQLVESKKANEDGIVASLVAAKSADVYVFIHYFNTTENAKAAYDKAMKSREEGKEEYETLGVGPICKMFGKIVYIGTPDAIEASQ